MAQDQCGIQVTTVLPSLGTHLSTNPKEGWIARWGVRRLPGLNQGPHPQICSQGLCIKMYWSVLSSDLVGQETCWGWGRWRRGKGLYGGVYGQRLCALQWILLFTAEETAQGQNQILKKKLVTHCFCEECPIDGHPSERGVTKLPS